MKTEFTSFASMLMALPSDNDCREYLELKRWGGVPTCPHCAVVDANHYRLKVKGEFKGMYKCKTCKERFTVTIGTMFEGSPIGLRKWFIAVYIFSAHKKGISSHQLARDLGVTQKTAWFMLHRLRSTFSDKSEEPMGGEGVIVEVDETIIGGKVKNMSNKKRKHIAENPSARNANKTTVVGIVERSNKVRFEVVDNGEIVTEIVKGNIDTSSVLMTDTANTYQAIGKDYAHHGTVDHSKKEYGRDGIYYTNTIEGAFSLLDRMITGIYHQVSAKHLQSYCDENGFRYNSRKITDKARFDLALVKTEGVKLNYSELIAK